MEDNNVKFVKISSQNLEKIKTLLDQSGINIDDVMDAKSQDSLEELKIDPDESCINQNIIPDHNGEGDLDLESDEDEDFLFNQSENKENNIISSQPEPVIPDDKPNSITTTEKIQQIEPANIMDAHNPEEIIPIVKKIIINVGGKKFNLSKKILDYLNINYTRLLKTMVDGELVYFLDRDPYYLTKIIEIIKIYGAEEELIIPHLSIFSDQLINEMCYYGIIDKKYQPTPKLKLKKIVSFSSGHDEIIKIYVGKQLFEISSAILSRSNYFNTKLKINKTNRFVISNVDPKFFRYVLNFLRTGELYINNTDIIKLLEDYEILHEKNGTQNINEDIVSHFVDTEPTDTQLLGCINMLDPRLNKMYQHHESKYYYPDSIYSSASVENFHIINSVSKLEFGSEIIFNLTDSSKNYGDCIEDLLLCIDIPVIKPTECYQYVDLIGYYLVENIMLIFQNDDKPRNIMGTSGKLLYLYPLIYKKNSMDYHQIMQIGENRTKLLYGNFGQNESLIDIHRITLPLFLFRNGCHNIPIKKMEKKQISAILNIKLSPLSKLFTGEVKTIPLLNIFLLANYVKLAPVTTIIKDKKIIQMQTNVELINNDIMYLYDRIHFVQIPIKTTQSSAYDLAIIPLDKFGFIRDFYFVIVPKKSANFINKFSDALIELEILQIKSDNSAVLHTKMDTTMLNLYIPLKKLGHKLPKGIYYYSFSSDPTKNQILGGLYGLNFVLRIKVKKMEGTIHFYANEYHREII